MKTNILNFMTIYKF